MRILFDVDGTLIENAPGEGGHARPNKAMVALLTALATPPRHTVFVASGGGRGYAVERCLELGIRDLVRIVDKEPGDYDLVFDDDPQAAAGLGRQLLQVKGGPFDTDAAAPPHWRQLMRRAANATA